MNPKILVLILAGFVGVWLILWDFIDFVTQGFNNGIWDWGIVQNGLPSIFVGFIIICIVGSFGIRVFK